MQICHMIAMQPGLIDLNQAITFFKMSFYSFYVMSTTHFISILIGFHIAYTVVVWKEEFL